MNIFSGIQPTGNLHIGNYLGALKQWKELQDSGNKCFFSIVDLHALTTVRNKQTLKQHTEQAQKVLLAVGLVPEKSVLFIQSTVPAHTQLAWILSTLTPMGDLERMTQFKDKKAQGLEANAGLFTYPILMAADILLYNTDKVPVGEDQIQHLELARTIARKFNTTYHEMFKEPQPIIAKQTARVMSLSDPTKKMSKSLGESHFVGMFEEPEVIKNKFKTAVTDSDSEIIYDPEKKPGVSNLLSIYAGFQGIDPEQASKEFTNASYAALKEKVADVVIQHLQPIQQTFSSLTNDQIQRAFTTGTQTAREISQQTIQTAYQAVGL